MRSCEPNSYNSPDDHRETSRIKKENVVSKINSKFFEGKIASKGTIWNFNPLKACSLDRSLHKLLKQGWVALKTFLINHNLPVWPEPYSCDSCPENYALCNNGADPKTWFCVPSCCGGQQLFPDSSSKLKNESKCKCDCPEGYEWVQCKNSTCNRKSFDCKDDYGYCVKTPPLREKLFWDSEVCRWKCLDVIPVFLPISSETLEWLQDQGEAIGITSDGAAKYVLKECETNFKRIPEANCFCYTDTDLIDSGIPTPPPGYIFVDNDVIPDSGE